MKTKLLAATTAALLAITPAIAAGPVAPLPAGKPAGTREAALMRSSVLWVGLAAAALGAAIISLDNGKDAVATGTGLGAP